MRTLNYIQAIAEGLLQAMESDEKVFLLGEGVDNVTGIYGTVLPAYQRFGPKRVIDTPLSENGLTGIAIGAALDGMRPVLFHQRNDFMLLTIDQLVNNAAKIPYVSAGRHRVPLTVISFVARKPGEGAQHTQSLQALFAHIPGLKVIMPANPVDAKGLLLAAIADDGPVIVLYHRALFEETAEVSEGAYQLPIGQARIVRPGRDLTLVAISAALKDGLAAAEQLAENISVEVIDLRSIRPLDKDLIINSVRRTGRLLVVDTGWPTYGVGAEIIAAVAEAGVALEVPPRRLGMRETPAPASPYLLGGYHPDTGQIVDVIKYMLAQPAACQSLV